MSIIPNINNQSIAILSDIEQWKEDIADAINTKGGNSTPDESFQQLAENIRTLPYAGISAEGIVQSSPFSLLNSLFNSFSNITEIYCEDTLIMNTLISCTTFKGGVIVLFPNLKRITLKKTTYFLINRNMIPSCTYFDLENTEDYYDYVFSYAEFVRVGKMTKSRKPFYTPNEKLRNFTIGQDTDVDLPFQNWTASDVIAEGQSGIDELNSNLYNNLLTKLYDHSEDGETRILQIGWLDYITPENIAYANAKGWTLTT